MFWVWFIITAALLSIAFSAGLISSACLYEFGSLRFWLTTIAIAMTVIFLALILARILSWMGHLNLEKINGALLKEN